MANNVCTLCTLYLVKHSFFLGWGSQQKEILNYLGSNNIVFKMAWPLVESEDIGILASNCPPSLSCMKHWFSQAINFMFFMKILFVKIMVTPTRHMWAFVVSTKSLSLNSWISSKHKKIEWCPRLPSKTKITLILIES